MAYWDEIFGDLGMRRMYFVMWDGHEPSGLEDGLSQAE